MDGAGSAWSSLGGGMILPSKLKEEIENLKLLVRDMRLVYEAELNMMKNEMLSMREEIGAIKNLKTEEKEEYNVFAYVDPSEVGIVTEVNDDRSDVKHVKGFVVPPLPVENDEVAEPADDPTMVEVHWWDGLDEDGISFELANLLVEHIVRDGGIMNNRVWAEVYPRGLKVTKKMKSSVKRILDEIDAVSYVQVDRLRGLYFDTNKEASDVYQELTGKTLNS